VRNRFAFEKEAKMKATFLAAALALTGCSESHIISATPQGGIMTTAGGGVFINKGYVQKNAAEAHCARYGKKAVFEGDPTSPEVDFKCVGSDTDQNPK
jgi:hypothetical protein